MPYRVIPGGASSSRVYLVDGGGNGDYATIQGALNAAHAQAPTASNRWLVLVGPGVYSESLTLYDYVDISGLAPGAAAVVSARTAQSAIVTAANCTLSNLRFAGSTTPIVAVGAAGLELTLEAVVMDESTPLIDGIEVSADSTVTLKGCDLQVGGDALYVSSGTVAVYNSRIAHYHTDSGAATEYPLRVSGGTVLVDKSVVENLGYAGAGIHFTANPKSGKVLHCTVRKASGTYAITADLPSADVAVVECILNGTIDSDVGVSSGNTVVSGI